MSAPCTAEALAAGIADTDEGRPEVTGFDCEGRYAGVDYTAPSYGPATILKASGAGRTGDPLRDLVAATTPSTTGQWRDA